jgi:amino acid transporter
MAQAALPGLIKALQTQGVFEIYLPFLLTFAIFYGLLRKIGIFKVVSGQPGQQGQEDSTANKISAVVAFVAAMYITIFSPAAIPISKFFANFFTQSSIAIVVLMITIMMLAMFFSLPFLGNEKYEFVETIIHWLVIGALLVAIGMFISSGGVQLFANVLPPNMYISSEDLALIILVIVTIIIIWSLLREGPREPRRIFKKATQG